jgi:hypothetical protein
LSPFLKLYLFNFNPLTISTLIVIANRITLAELDAAYQGKNALFNKYDAWFQNQTAALKQAVSAAAKKKQLKNLLSMEGEANPLAPLG